MSALGTKRTSQRTYLMSAFWGKADMTRTCADVRLCSVSVCPLCCGVPVTSASSSSCSSRRESGHLSAEFQCPLSGVKRTSVAPSSMSAFDPQRTWALLARLDPPGTISPLERSADAEAALLGGASVSIFRSDHETARAGFRSLRNAI
jgi:hypothetical protein